jgi:hypothetical protein
VGALRREEGEVAMAVEAYGSLLLLLLHTPRSTKQPEAEVWAAGVRATAWDAASAGTTTAVAVAPTPTSSCCTAVSTSVDNTTAASTMCRQLAAVPPPPALAVASGAEG